MMQSQICLVVCFALLGLARSEPPSNSYGTPLAAPISSYGTPNYNVDSGLNGHNGNNGHNGHDDDHGEPKAYEFGYQVKDDYSGNNYNRKESSDGNQVRGEYRVQLPDGRTQIVTYYADWQTGFHADVRYEGTAQYPEQYNNYQGGYNNGPSNQYGAPGYNNNNGYNNGGNGYNNGGSATSSVSIKDYSESNNGGNYNSNSGYNYNAPSVGFNSNNNNGNGYDSFSNNFGNKARPSYEYGAP